MSSSSRNTSKEDTVSELEPDGVSETELKGAEKHLEPKTEQSDIATSEELQYDQTYRQKNITKKTLATMAGLSLVAGSATAAAIGIGGALVLDCYGEDETYSLQKAEELYNHMESYTEHFDL